MFTHGKVAIVGLIGSVLLLSGCSADSDAPRPWNPDAASAGAQDGLEASKEQQKPPPNPKIESVTVWEDDPGLTKRCDGQVMIYEKSGKFGEEPALSAVFPHPECPPR